MCSSRLAPCASPFSSKSNEAVGAQEMITFFNIHGAMVYVDEQGAVTGYEDVFTKIEMCRRHYRRCGLGESYVDQYVR